MTLIAKRCFRFGIALATLLRKVPILVLTVIMLQACTQTGPGPKEGAGTLVGAGLGALAGSQIGSGKGQLAAVAIGALLGAWAGNEVGKSLDAADQAAIERAARLAGTAPLGQPIIWNNPNSGNHGTVTPVREGHHATTGAFCREFRQTIIIDGRTEEGQGTACRQRDGSWIITK